MARNVLGQMCIILLGPTVRATPFREYHKRMVARGVQPAKAVGHMAGKLSTVLYQMLKTMTPYNENQHRRALGLPSSGVETVVAAVDVTEEVAEMSAETGEQHASSWESLPED
jgi:hypothetical protein